MNAIRVSNGMDPDQDRHFVGLDLGSNCLQRASADDKVAARKDGITIRLPGQRCIQCVFRHVDEGTPPPPLSIFLEEKTLLF